MRRPSSPPIHPARCAAAGALLAGWLAAAGASSLAAGPYAPAGGEEGSIAIALDDPRLTAWATGVAQLTRGLAQIDDPGAGFASFGDASYALGPATGDVYDVVSLGDGGSITLTFDAPIADGEGWDFAVFENAFLQLDGLYFCELAFVEVSSDGENFFRFPATSLTPTGEQVASFAGIDPTDLDGLAGRDPAGWGTPFDLATLAGASPLLDVSAITHVRLVDVGGTLDPAHASRDAAERLINDPWPTPFATGGFDLEAVGVRARSTGPGAGYAGWRAAQFSVAQAADPAVSGPVADPDADGLANLLEYALGGVPLDAGSVPVPVLATTAAGEAEAVLTLAFARLADPALTYVVEASGDLLGWATVWSSTGEENIAGAVTVPDVVPLADAGGRRFLRLRVTQP